MCIESKLNYNIVHGMRPKISFQCLVSLLLVGEVGLSYRYSAPSFQLTAWNKNIFGLELSCSGHQGIAR